MLASFAQYGIKPQRTWENSRRGREILAYDADVLGRSDVVARFPIDLVGCLEIFLVAYPSAYFLMRGVWKTIWVK